MPVAVGVNDKRRLILIRDGDDEHEEDGHDCVVVGVVIRKLSMVCW